MTKLILLFLLMLLPVVPAYAKEMSGTIIINGGHVTLNAPDTGNGSFQVVGTWTGTLTPEVSLDYTTWVGITVFPPNSTTGVTSVTGNGVWLYSGAYNGFRLRATATVTGTATVKLVATAGGGGGGGGGGAAGSVTQGTSPWVVNETQIGSTNVDTNSGVKSAGTQRVVLATDQPQLTNKLLVTPDSVALPANQSVNVAQVNGVATLMGNGATGTGSQRVTIASDNTPFKVIVDSATSPTSFADAATFTPATTLVSPIAGFYQTTPTNNPLTTGQMGAPQLTVNRGLHAVLHTNVGVPTGVAATPLQVSLANHGANATAVKTDGSAVTQPVSDAALALAQAATTSGKTGPMTQAAVTTAPPTYTTAQIDPLSMTVGGGLRTTQTDGTFDRTLDPCVSAVKVYTPITTTANVQLITGTASKKTYICSIMLVSAAAENISLVAGTGTVCATSIVAVIGGTTAATGPNLAANGGFVVGDGAHAFAATTVNADNLCILKSGAGVVAGVMTSVVR
jgi:hypothetical protein